MENKLITELKKRFPDGIVIGGASAIVGEFGLTIQWVNQSGIKEQKRYLENEKLSIIEIKGECLEVADAFPHSIIHSTFFKGFLIN